MSSTVTTFSWGSHESQHAWSLAVRGAEPKHFPHSAVVVSESELLQRLRPPIADLQGYDQPDWTIFASRPLPPSSVERRFGSRVAVVFPVELAKRAPPFTCWIESVSEGWLFLIPRCDRNASLLVVGGGGDSLLAESRLVAAQIRMRWEKPLGNFLPTLRLRIRSLGPDGSHAEALRWRSIRCAGMAPGMRFARRFWQLR